MKWVKQRPQEVNQLVPGRSAVTVTEVGWELGLVRFFQIHKNKTNKHLSTCNSILFVQGFSFSPFFFKCEELVV